MNKNRPAHLLVYLAFLSGISVYPRLIFSAEVAPSSHKVVFVDQAGPPPGFQDADLNSSTSNYISVYYAGQFLGNVMGTYDLNTLTLTDLTALVEKIPGVLDPKAIIAALQGQQPNHADHLCHGLDSLKKPYCSVISPDVAGLIFDANNYRATIFINPKYLTAEALKEKKAMLPPSTAGFSYFANNNFSVSTSPGSQVYSLNNQSIFADGNSALNVNSNLTQTSANSQGTSGGNSTTSYSLQTVNISRFSNGKYYQFGMLTPSTGDFIGSPPVVGISMQNYGILPENSVGSPVQVFLPLPSQVNVYKNGYLISSQSFDAGKHFLDTSSFPNGSYDIVLKIINNIGQATNQTQFFVKQNALPPKGDPNYQVSFGLLQTTESSNYNGSNISLPSLVKEPIVTYTEVRKVGYSFGLQSSFISNFNRAYLGETLNYYGADWQLGPGVLVSNNRQYGSLFDVFFSPSAWPAFTFSSVNTRMFNSKGTEQTLSSDLSTGPDFSPITTTVMQSSNTANLAVTKRANMSASYQYSKNPGADGISQYGVTWTQTLFASPLMTWQMTGSFTAAAGSPVVYSIGLSASFTTLYDIGVSAGMGYDNSSQINNQDGSVSHVYKPNYTFGASKSMFWGENGQDNFNISLNGSQSYTSSSKSLLMDMSSQYVKGNLNIMNTSSKEINNNNGLLSSTSSSTSQMSGTLSDSMAYSNGHVSFGYQQGGQAGLMVNVKAPTTTKVDVFVDNLNVGHVNTNSAKAFFLNPYSSHQVTIQPASTAQYGFDDRPKQVTLYGGNIQYLEWTLIKEYVIFAQIVDPKEQPLPDMLMITQNSSDFNVTDSNGYIQASIASNTTALHFKNMNGEPCTVTLDPEEIKKDEQSDLVVLTHPLVCVPDSPK